MHSFSSYRNLVEIGYGGMATVYRATAPNGNLVAVKILALHLAADPTARLRFQQESNLGLEHPNIVRVVDAGVVGGAPFIVMDYITGESLDRRLTRAGSLTPQALVPILNDAARALDYAHGRGIVHRDVKPSNILIRTNGQALLADFGVAKSASLTAYTATAARVGSVFYMSPEQANGAFEITPASDIYSLGVTAYYALTGRHPFEGDNEIAIARMHIDTKPKHVCELNPTLPRAIGSAIMQALDKDPLRRPLSAGAFASNVEKAVRNASRPSRTLLRLKTLPAITILVLCIVAAVALATIQLLPAQFTGAGPTAQQTAQQTATVPQPNGTPSPGTLLSGSAAQTELATVTQTSTPLAATGTPTPAPSASSRASSTSPPTAAPTTAAALAPATSTPRPRPSPTRRLVRPTAVPTPRPPTRTPSPRPTRTPVVTIPPSVTATPGTPATTPPVVTTQPSPTSEPTDIPPSPTEAPTEVPTQEPTQAPTAVPPTDIPPTQVPPATDIPAATNTPPPTEAAASTDAP